MSDSVQYHDVSRETWNHHQSLIEDNRDQLDHYFNQLLWWNKKVNLVSRNAPHSLIRKHIYHSLLPLSLNLLPARALIYDAGTGGGLPGIPLSIASPDRIYILNDINFKKITAVHQMITDLDLTTVSTKRGEFDKDPPTSRYTLISKHSFKLKTVAPLLKQDPSCQRLILYKGADFTDEIDHQLASCTIDAYRLGSHSPDSFYSEKFILNIERSPTR